MNDQERKKTQNGLKETEENCKFSIETSVWDKDAQTELKR